MKLKIGFTFALLWREISLEVFGMKRSDKVVKNVLLVEFRLVQLAVVATRGQHKTDNSVKSSLDVWAPPVSHPDIYFRESQLVEP